MHLLALSDLGWPRSLLSQLRAQFIQATQLLLPSLAPAINLYPLSTERWRWIGRLPYHSPPPFVSSSFISSKLQKGVTIPSRSHSSPHHSRSRTGAGTNIKLRPSVKFLPLFSLAPPPLRLSHTCGLTSEFHMKSKVGWVSTQCSEAGAEVKRSGPELSSHELTFPPAGWELEDLSKNIKTWGRKERELGSNPWRAPGCPSQLEGVTILSWTSGGAQGSPVGYWTHSLLASGPIWSMAFVKYGYSQELNIQIFSLLTTTWTLVNSMYTLYTAHRFPSCAIFPVFNPGQSVSSQLHRPHHGLWSVHVLQ